MRSRLFWRRSAAAAGTYASAALGFGATVVALHVFSTETFGRYALVLAATAFVQSLLDLTVEEALVKFGFRYTERGDWGRLRRLFESAVAFKLGGGFLATALLLALAPVADSLLHQSGLTTPLMIGAFLPLAQCTENVGGVALILRGRYDLRAFFLFVSMALRFTAIAVGASYGLNTTMVAIVIAQVVATAAISVAGWIAYHRFPQEAAVPLGAERRAILSFVVARAGPPTPLSPRCQPEVSPTPRGPHSRGEATGRKLSAHRRRCDERGERATTVRGS